MLQKFIGKKRWVPRVEQVCTIFKNFGLRSDDLPICDVDVTALQTSDAQGAAAVCTPSNVVEFVETKMVHVLRLMDAWLRTCHVELEDIDRLLQVTFTVGADHNWEESVELLSCVVDCISRLISHVPEQQRADVMRRLTDFCLNMSTELTARHFIVEHLCPLHAHRELSMFMAYRVLEEMYLTENSKQDPLVDQADPLVDQASCSQETSIVPLRPPSTRQVYKLVSRPTFPLVSKNRWEKRQFDSSQLSDLFKVIQLIQAAVGNPYECTEDDKVRNTKFFHKRYRNLAASLPCES